MLKKASKFFLYVAIASPLIVNKGLFFPFITGKALFFRFSVELSLILCIGTLIFQHITLKEVKNLIKQPIFIAVFLFTALFIITTYTAVNPSFAFWSQFERGEGGWQILHYFLFFALLSLLFSSEKDWRRIIGWQVIVSTLVGLYAIGQAIHWPQWIINPPAGALSGTLGNPSYLGGYALFGMFFALWLALPNPPDGAEGGLAISLPKWISFKNTQKIQWLWALLALFQLEIFFSAKTRGSFVALGAGIIIMLVLWSFLQKKRNKYAITSIITALFLIIFGTTYLVTTIKGNAWTGFQPRLWTWGSAIAGVIEKPLFGWGAENFPFLFDRYYNSNHDGIEPWFDRAHNTPLEYLTSGGIPLFLAYIAIFWILYRRLFRMPNANFLPLFAALPAMYLINGLVLFEILPLYLILFLMFAFYLHYTNNFTFEKSTNDIASRQYVQSPMMQILFITSSIGIIASLYFTIYLPFHKNKLIITALQANNKTDQRIFNEYAEALVFWSPVGQQEAVNNLLQFTTHYIDFLKEKSKGKILPLEKIKQVMDFNELWYEKEKNNAVGVKALYYYTVALITAAEETNDKTYLLRAKELIKEGEEKAPTRLEFVRLAMQAATLEKDTAAFNRAGEKGKKLRPDLKW